MEEAMRIRDLCKKMPDCSWVPVRGATIEVLGITIPITPAIKIVEGARLLGLDLWRLLEDDEEVAVVELSPDTVVGATRE